VGSNETVAIWEVTGGALSSKLPIKYATAILFGPEGKHVAIANWNFYDPADRSVRIWDTGQSREVDRLPLLQTESPGYVDNSSTELAFTPDGRYLAIVNQAILRIWDMATRQEIERWESGQAKPLAFSADGRYLLAGLGTTVSAWLWGPEALIAQTCKRLARNLDPREWPRYLGKVPYRKTCPDLPEGAGRQ
jgi:WD40 repeat protein